MILAFFHSWFLQLPSIRDAVLDKTTALLVEFFVHQERPLRPGNLL